MISSIHRQRACDFLTAIDDYTAAKSNANQFFEAVIALRDTWLAIEDAKRTPERDRKLYELHDKFKAGATSEEEHNRLWRQLYGLSEIDAEIDELTSRVFTSLDYWTGRYFERCANNDEESVDEVIARMRPSQEHDSMTREIVELRDAPARGLAQSQHAPNDR